jgi:hypothetical protein
MTETESTMTEYDQGYLDGLREMAEFAASGHGIFVPGRLTFGSPDKLLKWYLIETDETLSNEEQLALVEKLLNEEGVSHGAH